MIEVLVGMIASGKSTWSKMRARNGWLVINDDAIVKALHAGNYTLYDKGLRPLYKAVEDHILHSAILLGRNVVIDRGLDINKRSRQRWIAIARSADAEIRAVLFDRLDPATHAMRRWRSDNRGRTLEYWLEVATAHDKRYDYPVISEGFCNIVKPEWFLVERDDRGLCHACGASIPPLEGEGTCSNCQGVTNDNFSPTSSSVRAGQE